MQHGSPSPPPHFLFRINEIVTEAASSFLPSGGSPALTKITELNRVLFKQQ